MKKGTYWERPRFFGPAAAGNARRFRPGEAERRGSIQPGSEGAWILKYDDRGDQGSLRVQNDVLNPGEFVSVRENDGQLHAFQVISIRRE